MGCQAHSLDIPLIPTIHYWLISGGYLECILFELFFPFYVFKEINIPIFIVLSLLFLENSIYYDLSDPIYIYILISNFTYNI